MSYKLTITGFTSLAQVQAFADWYEGQGEQHAWEWFEEREHEGEIDVTSMNTKSITTSVNDTDVYMVVDPQ